MENNSGGIFAGPLEEVLCILGMLYRAMDLVIVFVLGPEGIIQKF
jgi:hypothetical protein